MIRIGIVGVGATVSIAHYHALGYMGDDRCRITCVYDINKEGAEAFIRNHNLDAFVADDYDTLLENVDAVSICTPNAFHYSYAAAALEKGKHVLLEKPMGVEIEECRALEKLSRKTEAKSAIGLVYRFSSAIREAKALIEKEFTEIFTISGWFGGKRLSNPCVPFEWRMDRKKSGTGALGDFSSHLLDIAYFLTGKRADSVSAMTGVFIKERSDGKGGMREVENDDSATIIAKCGGTLMDFTVSRVGMDDVFLLITGDGGMIEVSLRNGGSLKYWPKKNDGGYEGCEKQIPVESQSTLEDWFSGEIPAFLDLIEGKDTTIASLSDGLYTESVIEAAHLSSLSGKMEEVS
ncbi:MAG: Gfo/Idh/MocA family protein [Candidatus Ornithospirochaeta sp.]